MELIRSNAVVINKSATELNAFTAVINDNPWCCTNNVIDNEQIKCKLLLCWFYVKKAWIEDLVSHVTIDKRTQLYLDMCGFLECLTKPQLNSKYVEFKITWTTEKLVLNNVATKWTGNCKWRGMWPRFNHLYKHGFVNTTNLVERLCHFIKYKLLDQKINRHLDQLIWATIGM